MILDEAERRRFEAYCKVQADSAREMSNQFGRIIGGAIGEELAKREKQRAAAYAIVGLDLRSAEIVSVSKLDNRAP